MHPFRKKSNPMTLNTLYKVFGGATKAKWMILVSDSKIKNYYE